MATIIGTLGNDTLADTAGNDDISALDGDDTITVTSGRDAVIGGTGHDLLVIDWRAAIGAMRAFTVPTDVGESGFEGGMIDDSGRRVDYRGIDHFWLIGGAGNDQMVGAAGNDLFAMHFGGNDSAAGGAGNDYFYAGESFSAFDRIDGGAGVDTLALMGTYGLTIDSAELANIERIELFSGAAAGTPSNYDLTLTDAVVSAGTRFQIIGLSLLANETLRFDGRAETDGSFFVRGGAGNDIVLGGGGADRLVGNDGRDILVGGPGDDTLVGGMGGDWLLGERGADLFLVALPSHSTSIDFDTIQHFQPTVDRIDVSGSFAGWAARLSVGVLNRANFDADLAAAVDSALGTGQAIVFVPDQGELAGRTIVVFDADASGSYQPSVDYVFEFVDPVRTLEQFAFFI